MEHNHRPKNSRNYLIAGILVATTTAAIAAPRLIKKTQFAGGNYCLVALDNNEKLEMRSRTPKTNLEWREMLNQFLEDPKAERPVFKIKKIDPRTLPVMDVNNLIIIQEIHRRGINKEEVFR